MLDYVYKLDLKYHYSMYYKTYYNLFDIQIRLYHYQMNQIRKLLW